MSCMAPSSDIRLEMRRVGGIEGVIKLLRTSCVTTKNGQACRRRMELGAALLSCGLAEATRSGRSIFNEETLRIDRDEDSVKSLSSDVAASLRMSVGSRALALTVKLLQAGAPKKSRGHLLAAVGALGSCVQEAGVSGKLFGILVDAMQQTDTPGCTAVSRALAVALHSSQALCKELTTQEWVHLFLGLAFPDCDLVLRAHGGNDPVLRENAAPQVSRSTLQFQNDYSTNYETQGNALSCLCSITQVSDDAIRYLCALGGVEPLFLLAFGNNDHLSGMKDETGSERWQSTVRIPTTSRPLTRQRQEAHARLEKRPMTTGALPNNGDAYARRQRKQSRPTSRTYSETKPLRPFPPNAMHDGRTAHTDHTSQRLDKEAFDNKSIFNRVQSHDTTSSVEQRRLPTRIRAQLLVGPTVSVGQHQDREASSDKAYKSRCLLAARCLLNCIGSDQPIHTCVREIPQDSSQVDTAEGEADTTASMNESPSTVSAKISTLKGGISLRKFETSRRAQRRTSRGPGTDLIKNDDIRKSRDKRRSSGRQTIAKRIPFSDRSSRDGAGRGQGTDGGGHQDSSRRVEFSDKSDSKIRSTVDPIVNDAGDNGKAALSRELKRLNVATKAITFLRETRSPLHQELAIALLHDGFKDSISRDDDIDSRTAHVENQENATHPQERLQVLLISSGCLTSLCWLLLHERPSISTGAAKIFSLLLSSFSKTDREGEGGRSTKRGSGDWMLSVIEQGCVPILRMVAGGDKPVKVQDSSLSEFPLTGEFKSEGMEPLGPHVSLTGPISSFPAESAPKLQFSRDADVASSHVGEWNDEEQLSTQKQTINTTDFLHGSTDSKVTSEQEASASPRQNVLIDENIATSSFSVERSTRAKEKNATTVTDTAEANNSSRKVAKTILAVIADEACRRHLARLVRVVTSSGNRELRANIAVALVLLSLGQSGGKGDEARNFLAAEGGVSTLIGLLRSPAGRSTAVSFLCTVAALLDDIPPPPDYFAVATRATGLGLKKLPQEHGSNEDAVVLVKDTLASFERGRRERGGEAEAKGIKMACPPLQVIRSASRKLHQLLQEAPQGELPVLHGRYRIWEEVMAHIGAPHTFLPSSVGYSSPFLIEMFVVAATFEIQDLANGYAWALWRRLERISKCSAPKQASAPRASYKNKTRHSSTNDVRSQIVGSASEQAPTFSPTNSVAKGLVRPGQDANVKEHAGIPEGKVGSGLTGERSRLATLPATDWAAQSVEYHGVGREAIRDKLDGGDTGKSEPNYRRHGEVAANREMMELPRDGQTAAGPDIFSLLKAALKGRHMWLCRQVFKEAITKINREDEDWLPRHPRELAALLDSLQDFMQLVFGNYE